MLCDMEYTVTRFMERGDGMALVDLPLFIVQELSGPYGPYETERINQIRKFYRKYQEGSDFETESTDSKEFEPTKLKARKIKRLISEQAEFMVGKPPDIKVTCPDERKTEVGKPNEAAMQKYVTEVLKKNLWSGKLLKGAKDCFIGGRVALKVSVTDNKLGIMFIPADGFIYETEYDDVDILKKVVLFYCANDTEDKKEQRWWRQRYRMENGKCLVSESLHNGYGEDVTEHEVKDEDTGLDRIPVYIIINDGLSGDTYGESDVETIMDEDSWYNKMRSANLDTIRKTMNQITWIAGASRKVFDNLRNEPGTVWDLQGDPVLHGAVPTVGTVENSFAYRDAYSETLGNVNENMHNSLGIPDLSLEKTQGLMTSGKGLKMLYWALICRCEAKWAAWKPALEWMAELLLYATEAYPSLKKIYGNFQMADHVVTVDNQYPLPEDEAEERALDLQEVGTGRSIRSYLKEWGGPDHKGLTDDEADNEIEQMVKEKRMLEDSFAGEM